MHAQVYTDGSCLQGATSTGHQYRNAYGGWAAICEHGHEGWVVRGRSQHTSNTRMEVVAVVQGLRSLPAAVGNVEVYTDATLLLVIYDWWSRGAHARVHVPRHFGLWREVAAELAARTVRFVLVRKGCERDVYWRHRRAHVFAQYEARTARHLTEGDGSPPLEPSLQVMHAYRPQAVRKLEQMDGRRRVLQGLQGRPVAADPLAVPGGKPRWAGVRTRGGRGIQPWGK